MKIFLATALAGTVMASTGQSQEPAGDKLTAKLPQPEAAVKDPERNSSGEISYTLMGRTFVDENINSRFARAMIGVDLKTGYENWLKARLKITQMYTTGTASNLYAITEGGASSNSPILEEASLTLIPLKAESFEGRLNMGVLQVRLNPVSSVMTLPGSWAAGSIDLESKGDDGSLKFTATQGTPSTRETSNRIIDEDTLPLFTGAHLSGDLKVFESDWKVSAGVGHFTFTDLSAGIASDSRMIGATTFGNGKGGVLFSYDYRGLESAVGLSYEPKDSDKFSLKASTLRNELAPQKQNAAQTARVDYTKYLNEKWDVTVGGSAFRIESDSIPAIFASATTGYTNRTGYAAILKVEQKKQKMTFTAQYARADVLDSQAVGAINGWQVDREIYTLNAEVKHDLF